MSKQPQYHCTKRLGVTSQIPTKLLFQKSSNIFKTMINYQVMKLTRVHSVCKECSDPEPGAIHLIKFQQRPPSHKTRPALAQFSKVWQVLIEILPESLHS